jgi:pilus assembly protein Flp/PilA
MRGKIGVRCHEVSGAVLCRNMTRVQNFLGDETGVTAIEYALIASLIAVFIIVAVQYVGTQVSTVFTEVGNSLK